MSNKISPSPSPIGLNEPHVEEKKIKKPHGKFSTEAPQGQTKVLAKRVLDSSINNKLNLANPMSSSIILKIISLQETFLIRPESSSPINDSRSQAKEPSQQTTQSQPPTLTVLDKLLLKQIFNKWHLNDHSIRLLDILGLDICTSISELDLVKKYKEPFLADFCLLIFNVHIRLVRDLDQTVPSHTSSDHYIFSSEKIIEKLIAVKTNLSTIAGVQTLEKLKFSVKKLGAKIDLLITIFKTQKIRLLEPAGFFEGSEQLNYPNKNSQKENLNDLELYIDYYALQFSAALKNGKFILDTKDIFNKWKKQINLLRSSFNEKNLKKATKEVGLLFEMTESLTSSSKRSTQKAIDGSLTHEEWLSAHSLPIPKNTKPQKEFIQSMIQQCLSFDLLDHALLMCYYQLIIHIIKPHSPEYISLYNHTARFSINVMACPAILEKTRSNYSKNLILSSFQNHLLELLIPIEQLFDEYVVFLTQNPLEEKIFLDLNGSISAHRWISFLKGFKDTPPLLQEAKTALHAIPDKLIEFLKQSLREHTEIDQEAFKNHIQQICFQNGLFLINILMLFEDVEAILNQFPQKTWISDELLNLIFLDLEDIFPIPLKILDENKTVEIPALEEEEQVDLSHSLSNASLTPTAKPKEKPKTLKAKTVPPKPKSYPPLSPTFLREHKTKKLLAMLGESGFELVREKKHKWLCGPNGEITCVPRGKTQPIGTVQAIFKQATSKQDEKK